MGQMANRDDATSGGPAPGLRSATWSSGRPHRRWDSRPTRDHAALGPDSPRLLLGLYDLGQGLALGTTLTGVGIMALRRWRDGKPYPSLPGHWLLMLGLAAAVANGVASAAFGFLTRLITRLRGGPRDGQLCRRCSSPVPHLEASDVIGVYHQAIGWDRGRGDPVLAWHSAPRLSLPWLSVFLVFGLAAARSRGPVRSLILIRTPRPCRRSAGGVSSRPTSTRGSSCSGVGDAGRSLGMSGAARGPTGSTGPGRDLARHGRPPVRHVPG